MWVASLLAALFALCLSQGVGAAEPGTVSLRWYGHAFFLLTSAEGVRIAMDPFGNIGYPLPEVQGDVVTISHEHSDHNNAALVKGKPVVLQGLEMGGQHWTRVNFRLKDARIATLPAYHDRVQGKERGLNTIFVVEASGLRIVHMSDIGHVPSDDTIRTLGKVDVLLVPVGGVYSIDGKEATELVARLKPAVAIPIHYKTEATRGWPITDEKPFLEGKERVRQVGKTVEFRRDRLPSPAEIWVMDYR